MRIEKRTRENEMEMEMEKQKTDMFESLNESIQHANMFFLLQFKLVNASYSDSLHNFEKKNKRKMKIKEKKKSTITRVSLDSLHFYGHLK